MLGYEFFCVKIKEIISSYVNIYKKLWRHKKEKSNSVFVPFLEIEKKKIKRLFYFRTNNNDTLVVT